MSLRFDINQKRVTIKASEDWMMKWTSSKRKKPPSRGGSWLVGIGTLLVGIAAVCEVAFKIVIILLGK